MPALTQVSNYTAAGRLAFGSVLAGYATLLPAVSGSVRKLIITNSLDAETVLSLDGGTTDFIFLPAQQGIIIDFDTSMHWAGTCSVKRQSTAPTVGAISAGVLIGN